ncbi:MAG: MFS transporter [Anaerolineaceae bacterium]|jgi:MFS family permease
MAETVETNRGAKEVLANPEFRKLWIGQTISQIGDGLTTLAMMIVINQLTGSTAALAGIAIALALPQLLFGMLAGVFVDRWDRKKLMIVSDILRGALIIALIFVRDASGVWIFYVVGFLQAAVGTFFFPAKGALIPLIMDKELLLAANGLSQTTQVITGVVGSALAGFLVGAAGSGWPAFSLDSISFFVSALFIARMIVPRVAAEPSEGGAKAVFSQLGEGVRFVFSRRMLVGVMVTFAITMLGIGAINVLFIPLLVQDLKVPTAMLGFVDAAQVIGMVLGGGLVSTIASRLKANRIIVGGVVGLGVCVGAISIMHSIWLVYVALFFLGLCLTPVQATASTLMQKYVPNEKRGRAGSAINTAISVASVTSMALAGVLGDVLGVRNVFVLSGLVVIVAGLMGAFLMRETPQADLLPVEENPVS